jgi:hypothetical protein
MGLLSPRSPVSAKEAQWVTTSLDWCLSQFEPEVIAGPVIVPNTSFFPGVYAGADQDVLQILTSLCQRVGVRRESVHLEFLPVDPGSDQLGFPVGAVTRSIAGHYQPRSDGGFVVSISDDQLPDPLSVSAVLAHELAHVRLLGENRIHIDRPDLEELTDLATVALGAGVLTANASLQSHSSASGWSTKQIGYLDERMLGYALARYTLARHDPAPSWADQLHLNPRTYMRHAIAYLNDGHAV